MSYERRRNLVVRADGRRVNVARPVGQLFVCADGCCCGRVEDGFAPVPRDVYHQEWERRRLRNVVHLTIGGCLGPCGLANVAMLLMDGQSLWFHSMNGPEPVWQLYDFIESWLDDGIRPPLPEALEQRIFTAARWQPRPDGQPVDDYRPRRLQKALVPGHPGRFGCELPTPAVERVIAQMEGPAALPRRNGELVFATPWEARAFGLAVALSEAGVFGWEEFRQELIRQIAVAEATEAPFQYYVCWFAALEAVLAARGAVTPAALDEVAFQFEFGERDEVYFVA